MGTVFAGRRRPVQALGVSGPLQLDLSGRELACYPARSDLGVVLWHSE